MSIARYALGIAALLAICASLGLASVALRARLLPAWRAAPARLAESVIGLALLLVVLELLGAIGLFRLEPIVVACVLLGGALVRVAGWPERASTGGPAAAAVAGERPLIRAIAFAAAGLVLAEWLVPTLHSYDVGMRAFDSLWYHMPWAATFAQTGHVTPLHFTDVEYLTAFYPASAELLHGLGIVLLGSDVLSPGLNLAFLGLVLLAAWCIGRPRGLGPLTMVGAALALATPMLRFSQAGSAANDVVGVFFLLAAVALMVNGADSPTAPRARAPLALAAVAAGLALAVKLSLLAPVLVLTVGVVAIVPSGQRRSLSGLWVGWLVLAGGFWYVRNLIAVGNPLPWLSLGFLPTPDPPLQAHTAFSVLHYLGDGQIWSRYFGPGLADGLGPLWPLIVIIALLGPLACVVRSSDRTTRMLGLVALASLVAYTVTPESAAGPRGHPSGFAFNLRYAAPALTLALTLTPFAIERDHERAREITFGALAVLVAATVSQSRLWPAGYAGAGLLVAALAVGLALLAGLDRQPLRELRSRLVAVAVVGVAVLGAGAALGYAGERHYLRGRYRYEPRVSSLATLWQWFRRVHGARVALAGTFGGFFSYPIFGLDASNHVAYVGQRGAHGSFRAIVTCQQWRRAIDDGAYRYVVSTPGRDPWRPRRLFASPEDAWTRGAPGVQAVFSSRAVGQPIAVYKLGAKLDPGGCAGR